MSRPLKILSIIDIPWNSGLANYAFEQAKALRAGGHAVTFACPAGSAAMKFAAAERFAAVEIPGRKEYCGFPRAARELDSLVKSCGIGAVCAHSGLAQTAAWYLRRRNPGLKVVRVKADARRPSVGFSFSSVDRVISASAYIENQYLAAGLEPEKSSLIRQGIAAPPFEHPPAAPPYNIGILGRLDPVKGHACFLEAAALLLKVRQDLRFHVAGYEAGIKYAGLKAQAEKLGISAAVEFHGRVADTFAFMKSCHAGVIASLGSEAVSRAALEWLACGRPLVSTSVGSLPEFVPKNMLVPPGDATALAEALEDLLSSEENLAHAGPINRERAVAEFSVKDFEEATRWLFEDACGAGK